MPASNFDFYLQEARNNFDAVRPAPIPTDANLFTGQCQSTIHISTNCYYGYHDPKNSRNQNVSSDCEMQEAVAVNRMASPLTSAKKRCADNADFPQSKRLRQEGMVPTPSNYNPCFPRPTHNNPDVSRCLMAHMI